MATFQVDSEAVIAKSAAAKATIERIRAETGSLHTQLTELQGSWSGAAASAFQALVAEWRAAAARHEENLGALSQALAQAGQQYADIEQANARLFAR
ncbi:MAG TPA: WXG100 family type VII secretion target [Terrimesophilobacter sp.]|nr:WXG100 family type VII secretion target [Terrimesophilobacter sp.]HRP99668.1 WXG100 family type VII secretion target [Terrimesophilobacter sp.]